MYYYYHYYNIMGHPAHDPRTDLAPKVHHVLDLSKNVHKMLRQCLPQSAIFKKGFRVWNSVLERLPQTSSNISPIICTGLQSLPQILVSPSTRTAHTGTSISISL